ncbi:putative nicotine oxidoreductase [Dermacentor albipictus]|uniref:putative nicotine oxidoreductase n=1 Tax=Dermacentor albipictus TaxID=60249 RepID=UPI0038FCB164
MFGFRVNLSTQDVLLQLKEEVQGTMPKNGENVVMALDIKGTFDNVSHTAIMEGLTDTSCGRRINDYVKDFLTNRTATVRIGELRSDVFTTPSNGTPEGSVISPIFFNGVMIGLAERLSRIQGIQHAMHADDITSG